MKVNVLGFTYDVTRGYVEGRCEGTTDHLKQKIRIDSNLNLDNTVETLLHEIIHCIEYAMNLGLDDLDVTRISRGLYSVIEDPQNQAFWAALAGSDEMMEEEEGYVALSLSEDTEELEDSPWVGPASDPMWSDTSTEKYNQDPYSQEPELILPGWSCTRTSKQSEGIAGQAVRCGIRDETTRGRETGKTRCATVTTTEDHLPR
jgi:hypothetical protein